MQVWLLFREWRVRGTSGDRDWLYNYRLIHICGMEAVGALGIWNALDGIPRKRLSSRQCGKQAMEGLFVAKHQLYRVLKSN